VQTTPNLASVPKLRALTVAVVFAGGLRVFGAGSAATKPAAGSDLPPWLTTLAVGGKESYDDNVLGVSGLGLPKQSSWVSDGNVLLGLDFASLVNAGPALSGLTFGYQGERADYHDLPSEDYTSHRFTDAIRGKDGDFSYSFDNAFLYVDGNKLAETYAANQLSGAAANQGDKYRNNYAHSVARERRNQYQDRYNAQVQWNFAHNLLFLRAVSTLTNYKLNTDLFNTSKAPYLGYQDYINRWDINTGGDLGLNIAPNFALTVGYRNGNQNQDQFSPLINSDQHYSSNHYQRLLFGFEGQPLKWLAVKFAAGPDFRDFNPNTPIIHDRTTRYYGEGTATATFSKNQTLTFTYRQWIFVSSTGLVPYDDISYALLYHLGLTDSLGIDLGARYLEANYRLGNDTAGSAPSLRDDLEYEGSAGLSYLVIPHLTASIAYVYDKGENGLTTLPASLDPAYRDFNHGVTTLTLKYSF
jgi:hypothetical protein